MRRCFVCLGTRHIAKFCRAKGATCPLCSRRHHQSVCEQSEEKPEISSMKMDTVVSSLSSTVNIKSKEPNTVLLQTAKAWTEGPGGRKIVRCLIDGGSQRSFVHERLVRSLQLPVLRQETLNLHTFGSPNSLTTKRNTVKMILENVWNTQQKIEIEAIETPQVSSAVMKVPDDQIQRLMKDRGLQLADFPLEGDPELLVLIGADFYWKVVSGKIERLTDSLVALDSTFGWAIQGIVSNSSEMETTCMHITVAEDNQISKQLHAFWEIESLGIIHDKPPSVEEAEALETFEQTVIFKDGRYLVELPWKHDRDTSELKDNYKVARKRFEALTKRFRNDDVLYERYNDVIQDYLQQDICEEVQDMPTAEQASTVKYYMPHHPVIQDDKSTTKLRIVIDASSHEEGSPSLNDCLLIGPNLNPDLLHVLLKFRLHKVAFTADIAKAFLQIGLKERDKDVVRFLWTYDPSSQNSESELRIMRMNRVVFGVASSPFLLAATIRTHLNQYESEQPKTVAVLRESLYVDDLIASLPDVDEACFITTQAKAILSAAGMNLRKWMTNSSNLRARWMKDEIESTADSETHGIELKVLGLIWRQDHDDFVFDLSKVLDVLKRKESTKRSVLQISSRIFDPIGFLTPYTIRVKCLFQEMWERGLKWDEELPPDLAHKWRKWCDELPQLHDVAIPRWYHILMSFAMRVKELTVQLDICKAKVRPQK